MQAPSFTVELRGSHTKLTKGWIELAATILIKSDQQETLKLKQRATQSMKSCTETRLDAYYYILCHGNVLLLLTVDNEKYFAQNIIDKASILWPDLSLYRITVSLRFTETLLASVFEIWKFEPHHRIRSTELSTLS